MTSALTPRGSTQTWRDRRAWWSSRLPVPCSICGLPVEPGSKWHLHHPVPRIHGGTDSESRPAHAACNLKAGARGGFFLEPGPAATLRLAERIAVRRSRALGISTTTSRCGCCARSTTCAGIAASCRRTTRSSPSAPSVEELVTAWTRLWVRVAVSIPCRRSRAFRRGRFHFRCLHDLTRGRSGSIGRSSGWCQCPATGAPAYFGFVLSAARPRTQN